MWLVNGPGEESTMRIALTTSGNNLDAPLDDHFGRAPKHLIYYTETGVFCVEDNDQNLNTPKGAGIKLAIQLAEEGVDCVITGNCGPKAYATLDAAGIPVYSCKECTIYKAIALFKKGKLKKLQEANVEAHWV